MYTIVKWLRVNYNKSVHSIGIYPGIIAFAFLLLFMLSYAIEQRGSYESIKHVLSWLNLRNADAARTIVSTITTGILGLAVFSFSMVMVVMSQAATQISNRILDNFIGSTFQQITLGFYIGTILASFFLLTVVDDRGVHGIPSVTVSMLVALTIIDIFLFVSFLHYITQSVRFEQLIKTIHNKTIKSIKAASGPQHTDQWQVKKSKRMELTSPVSDYFQGINSNQLLKFATRHNIQIEFFTWRCTYVLKGEPLLAVHHDGEFTERDIGKLFESVDFYSGQEIDKNYFYGFLHLAEVAMKAMSPAINDPGTAVLSIHALSDLLADKIDARSCCGYQDHEKNSVIFLKERSVEDIFRQCIYPVWDYVKNDRLVRRALKQMLQQLRHCDHQQKHTALLDEFEQMMAACASDSSE